MWLIYTLIAVLNLDFYIPLMCVNMHFPAQALCIYSFGVCPLRIQNMNTVNVSIIYTAILWLYSQIDSTVLI